MKITSKEYKKAEKHLMLLTENFIKQERVMKEFQEALGEVEDQEEQSFLLVELGRVMDEFARRVSEL